MSKHKGTDFQFPTDFGFSGSAGKVIVRGYARGGPVATAKGVQKQLATHAALPASKAHGKPPKR